MSASVEVVESVEDDVERLKPSHVESIISNVRMMSFNLYMWIELLRRLFRNLVTIMVSTINFDSFIIFSPELLAV